jgi:hypothetical protein
MSRCLYHALANASASWSTSVFDAEVAALREEGVAFQTFEMDGVEWNEGVAAMGDSLKAVWFSDPDGNILNVSTGEMWPTKRSTFPASAGHRSPATEERIKVGCAGSPVSGLAGSPSPSDVEVVAGAPLVSSSTVQRSGRA